MKKRILKSNISIGTYSNVLKSMFKLQKEKKSSYICISNVHMTIEVVKDIKFEKIVNDADIATTDGMPLAKAIKYLYGISQDRIAGMDLVADIMKECENNSQSIFIYGLTDKTLKNFVFQAKNDFPRLQLKVYSPPFRELSEDEKRDVIEDINKFSPSFVFVGLGCPKQEKWMSEHKGKINSCMIGLGGALEVYAGVKDRAPKWMQENSLEWLYRLIQDPKRLWKRYFVTNSMFIILLVKQLIEVKLFNKVD